MLTSRKNTCVICNADLVPISNKRHNDGHQEESLFNVANTEQNFITDSTEDNATSSTASNTTAIESFCNILTLSLPTTKSILRELEDSEASSPFCNECSVTINNLTTLLDQIRNLQEQVHNSKCQIESQLKECYIDHVLEVERRPSGTRKWKTSKTSRMVNYADVGVNGTVTIKHLCTEDVTNRKGECSTFEKVRQLVISDLRSQAPSIDNVNKHLSENRSESSADDFQSDYTTRARRSSPSERGIRDLHDDGTQSSDTSHNIDDNNVIGETECLNGTYPDSPDWTPNGIDDDAHSLHGAPVDQEDEVQNKDILKEKFGLIDCSVKLQRCITETPKNNRRTRSKRPRSPKRTGIKSKGSVVRKKHPIETFKCPDCPELFRTEYKQKLHYIHSHGGELSTLFPYSCSNCGKMYDTEQKLKLHLKSQGGQCQLAKFPELASKVAENGTLKFQCNICQTFLRTKGKLSIHLAKHTKEKPHTCEICGEGFKVISRLREHKLLRHFDVSSEDPHPFKCTYKDCSKIFGTNAKLQTHLKVHREEFNFNCETCSYKAVTFGQLNVHIRTVHTETTKYKCTFCPSGFGKNARLKRHILSVHTVEAGLDLPYSCQYCGKSFATKVNLTRHEITHTGDKPLSCTICGKRFSVRDYLRSHMLTHAKVVRKKKSKSTKSILRQLKVGRKSQTSAELEKEILEMNVTEVEPPFFREIIVVEEQGPEVDNVVEIELND